MTKGWWHSVQGIQLPSDEIVVGFVSHGDRLLIGTSRGRVFEYREDSLKGNSEVTLTQYNEARKLLADVILPTVNRQNTTGGKLVMQIVERLTEFRHSQPKSGDYVKEASAIARAILYDILGRKTEE